MNEHEEWELLSAYIDGELSPAQRSAMDEHLSGCAFCRRELETLGHAKRLTASAPHRALPPDLLAELERRFERPSWMERLRSWDLQPRVWVPAGATAAALLSVGLWFGLRGTPEEEFLPLEPLLAAHARYSAEGLVPDGDPVASNFSAQMSEYHESR